MQQGCGSLSEGSTPLLIALSPQERLPSQTLGAHRSHAAGRHGCPGLPACKEAWPRPRWGYLAREPSARARPGRAPELLRRAGTRFSNSSHPGLRGEQQRGHGARDEFGHRECPSPQDSSPRGLRARGRSGAISLQPCWPPKAREQLGGNSGLQHLYGQSNLFYDQITPG